MWQTTRTTAAIRPAAKKPQSCESNRMPRAYACILVPSPIARGRQPPPPLRRRRLFHRQRFVDQLLAVRHFFGELGVRALLGHLEPLVVFLRRERHNLDVMLL